MIKVSIIVPVYNTAKYLRKCLNSLVNQTLKEIEIIIVNDGSSDESEKIAKYYSENYPDKVRYFSQDNSGVGAARNKGIENANGEYIGFVDSDDYVELNMFEKMYEDAQRNNSDIVICLHKNEKYPVELKQSSDSKKDVKKIKAMFGNTSVCNKLYRKSCIKELRFRPHVWYEDVDFGIKAIFKARDISFINEELYHYVFRNGSIMNNDNIQKNLDILSSFNEVLLYIENNQEYKKYIDEIEYLAINHILLYAIVRILNSKSNKNKLKVIKELIKNFKNKFKNYKNNKYLNLLRKKHKLIFILITNNCMFAVKFLFKLKRLLEKTPPEKESTSMQTQHTYHTTRYTIKTTTIAPIIRNIQSVNCKNIKKLTKKR